MKSEAIKVTASTFAAEVIDSDVPVLVHFWATWCGPSKRLAVVLDRVAQGRNDGLLIAEVDWDQEHDLTFYQYNVDADALPTMILFTGGQPVKTIKGYMPEDELRAEIDRALYSWP
jgi:thioredoxin 1